MDKGAVALTKVAPLVGAWIEINSLRYYQRESEVAPLVGAWIEIVNDCFRNITGDVAPLVGAWIEIIKLQVIVMLLIRRSPRGSVD